MWNHIGFVCLLHSFRLEIEHTCFCFCFESVVFMSCSLCFITVMVRFYRRILGFGVFTVWGVVVSWWALSF